MTTTTWKCEFCDEPNVGNHLLECEMVLGYLFDGDTFISFAEETTVQLVTSSKKPRRIPLVRWKTILDLSNALRGKMGEEKSIMYA